MHPPRNQHCCVQATFRDKFDLHPFPFDVQSLTITVTCNCANPKWAAQPGNSHSLTEVALVDDPCPCPPRGDFSMLAEFQLTGEVMDASWGLIGVLKGLLVIVRGC